MIEITVFAQNKGMTSDAAIAAQDVDKSELTADGVEQLPLDDTDDTTDSNSFVALFTELTTIQPVKTEITTETSDSGEENSDAVITEAEQTLPEINVESQQQDALKDNVALTWINSASYEPPQYALAEKEAIVGEKQQESDALISSESETALPETLNLTPREQASVVASEGKKQPQIAVTNLPLEWNKALYTASALPEVVLNEALTGTSKAIIPDAMTQVDAMPLNLMPTSASFIQQATQSVDMAVPKQLTISVPVTDPQWSDACMERIVWMGQQGIKSALITVHPEALGPLEIRLKVEKESASLHIVSHSGMVRDLLDQAMPRLRDMMMGQGIALAEAEVRSERDTQQFSQSNQTVVTEDADNSEADNAQVSVIPQRTRKGLIDYFA